MPARPPPSPVKRSLRNRTVTITTDLDVTKHAPTTKATKTTAAKARKTHRTRATDHEEVEEAPNLAPVRATRRVHHTKAAQNNDEVEEKQDTKPTSKAAPATKRRTRAQDNDANREEELKEVEPKSVAPEKKPKATRATKAKKTTADATHAHEAGGEAPVKTRTRATRAKKEVHEESEKDVPEPHKARGRPRKVHDPKSEEECLPAPPVKKVARATRATASTASTAAKLKKKVTFQDELQSDKENLPLAEKKATGLRAKPVRRVAPTKGTRTKKPTATSNNNDKEKEKENEEDVRPLSPKKAKQMTTKFESVDSDDELSGSKTPMRVLSKSPVKPPASSPIKVPVPKLDFHQGSMSSRNDMKASVLASPARRPPQSPFKDAFKGTPMRVNLGDSLAQPILEPPISSFKAQLLHSPARRPAPSPMKSTGSSSMIKPRAAIPILDTEHIPNVDVQMQDADVEDLATICDSHVSPFRRSVKVYNMAPVEPEEPDELDESEETEPSEPTLDKADSSAEKEKVLEQEDILEKGNAPEKMDVSEKEYVQEDVEMAEAPIHDADTKNGESRSSEVIEEHELQSTHPVPEQELQKFQEEDLPKSALESTQSSRSTTPPGLPWPIKSKAFQLQTPATQYPSDDDESEDELQSMVNQYDMTPSVKHHRNFITPTARLAQPQLNQNEGNSIQTDVALEHSALPSITPLAMQLSQWRASSPEKKANNFAEERPKSIFSPNLPITLGSANLPSPSEKGTPLKNTFFEDAFASEQEGPSDELLGAAEEDVFNVQPSQDSQASQEYGDENQPPLDENSPPTDLFDAMDVQEDFNDENTPPIDIDPLLLTRPYATSNTGPVSTPVRRHIPETRVVHTVAKVPLKPADDDDTPRVSRKRARSLSGTSGRSTREVFQDLGIQSRDFADSRNDMMTPVKRSNTALTSDTLSTFATPGRTPRSGADAQILKGVVVYVDVHTSEGADASGVFTELLTEMGARCVKQWAWNPRAGTGAQTSEDQALSSKIGITHVVFKDGGVRTLEKVRDSHGVVLCVGVGWVLDCEGENKWLDESTYAVDTSLIPRGGHRRRKSMEPKALAKLNGTAVVAEAPAPQEDEPPSPMEEFIAFNTPSSRRQSFQIPRLPPAEPPRTPRNRGFATEPISEYDEMDELDFNFETPAIAPSAYASPTTPYYLSQGAKLVQKTCPPKQIGQRLFPLSGNISEQPDENLRKRLLAARRKSLQFAPKTASPLGRAVSYGL
ncbi:MAG: hypothetical protein M1834_006786 [Cirrosporium novae-zelandiae]|nr:MAG: hypothetical protein M1834_006786 [Cirrosporium novae-zelandiae]